MKKIKSFFLTHLTILKILIITITGIIAFFVAKDNPWNHWSWMTYGSFLIFYLIAECIQYKQSLLSPLDKVKKYLLNFDGWEETEENNWHYKEYPEFTMKTNNEDNNLDFTQEWTRGEIGCRYNCGNSAYYVEFYHYQTLLKQIHIVQFDGGKKTIVAPDWEFLNGGRIYFYFEDSMEYVYQKYITEMYKKDYSKELRNNISFNNFSIPIFKNEQNKNNFIKWGGFSKDENVETNNEEQNKIFHALIDKYLSYKKKCRRTRFPMINKHYHSY
ncbi:MAG: hypothetical protein KAJ40_04770 [Alphaproteobacteria bacterium]|nr:hypothetical protein [Alphaproteobacteria bacterium]